MTAAPPRAGDAGHDEWHRQSVEARRRGADPGQGEHREHHDRDAVLRRAAA
jgi:hypothetical protein